MKWRYILSLIIIAPVISNLLFGAIRISNAVVLILLIGTWGCFTLLIREATYLKGYVAAFFLGLALAASEELIIQQTSLAPLIGQTAEQVYSRKWDVNWLYLLWALGYESVWVVLVPIQLITIIFPESRSIPWVGNVGRIVFALIVIVASLVAWYSWTQILIPQQFPNSKYTPSALQIGISILTIATLIALGIRNGKQVTNHKEIPIPTPTFLLFLSFILCFLFCSLVIISYGAIQQLPALIPLVSGSVIIIFSVNRLITWSSSTRWDVKHRLAIITGALYANMLVGFGVFILSNVPFFSVDFIGKIVLNLAAAIGLEWLRRNSQRSQNEPQQLTQGAG
ncbi:MAG TPA: hypothetical protein PLX35_11960 [Cyclobacteriaceae bacterium]|nr:hypothetical protein [Cyclobacteriaceae bacterium]